VCLVCSLLVSGYCTRRMAEPCTKDPACARVWKHLRAHQQILTYCRTCRFCRRDYEAIVQDFVTLDFIPPGTDLRPILPVLAKVRGAAAPRDLEKRLKP